jgi:hypothetical protein
MGLWNKIMFWKKKKKKRGNVSPVMVDAGVCTEEPLKCDVGTTTEDLIFEGEMNSHEETPPVEYIEGGELFPYYSPPEWPQPYEYFIPPPQEYEGLGHSYSYGAPAPEYAEWRGEYAYSSPPVYPQEWFYVAPL